MGGSNQPLSEPRWWESYIRDAFKPEDELATHLRELARCPFEHSSVKRIAFLQAAEVIERLLLVTTDSPSTELAMIGYPGYADDVAARILDRMRSSGCSAAEAISEVAA